ncbi:MAG: DUF2007 domain-containing protein [Dehalococcoidia bacterium]|nr:hypothetical protein [Chloroflexota bacterium]MXY42594.1 DUF2007 domain-containing protein [Dehalococcoidia bacterium]MYB50261.1 DUF2007 domain-containing protein [Dehalococcoidia bacterium]MYD50137.1 DUF2007 domain-containing protein [Dehalococcoidia bacterium]
MDWLKSLFGLKDDPDRLVRVGGLMPEPEAQMWVGVLKGEGIGAVVQNEGLPPYTSSMGSNYSVWVRFRDAEAAEQMIMGRLHGGGPHETT